MVFERLTDIPVNNYQILGDKVRFKGGKVAQNRFMKAALTEMISTWHDTDLTKRGIPTQGVINLYEKWGNGGFGIILTGNIQVDPNHLEAARNAIICKENYGAELLYQYKKWAKVAKSDGALAIMQISHAGRQTPIAINTTPYAPSEIQLTSEVRFTTYGVPVALTEEQIKTEVIDRFTFAAKVAFEAGFDGVQLHGAHGYLLSQFMSPSTNKRTDKYGGSIENRSRIVVEIYDSIRAALGDAGKDFVIGIKTNSVEFQNKGLQVEDAKVICKKFVDTGFDFVELSGGTYEKLAFQHLKESTKAREAFFLEFTDQIRSVFKNTSTKVYVTGGFRTVAGMVNAVAEDSTDGIGLGRPATGEPDLPKKILAGQCWSSADQKFDPQDMMVTVLASSSQMFQMGEQNLAEAGGNVCHGIADFSRSEEAENYKLQLPAFAEKTIAKVAAGRPIHGVLKYVNIVK